jgi:hypothetical protein
MISLDLTDLPDLADFMISVFNLGFQESPQIDKNSFTNNINSQSVQILKETLKGLNPDLTAVKFLEGMAKQGNHENNIPPQEAQVGPQAAPVPLDPQVQNQILTALKTEIDEKPAELNQTLTEKLRTKLDGATFQKKDKLRVSSSEQIKEDIPLKVCEAFSDPRHTNVELVDENNDNFKISLEIDQSHSIDERKAAYEKFFKFCDSNDNLNFFLSQYLAMDTFANVLKHPYPVKLAGDNFILMLGSKQERQYRATKLKNGDFKFNLTLANSLEKITPPDGSYSKMVNLDPTQSHASVSMEFVYPYSEHKELDPQHFKDVSFQISYTLVPKILDY